ncbi:DSD1 family PLP-dependent enzyme [Variovorax terrae]|uniref:DSD1 family PLP-dependent enzyme n=1 Tax=Variovorax terrae TaxID=2923278 RepID=A0A9X2AKR8_9BURK|nr:DSD1 family PLP-dependent enzyme [Variovorax terrae]MCJ0761823.1 DSD1 family PLP-dependent enzyme [Variovorax terrae]
MNPSTKPLPDEPAATQRAAPPEGARAGLGQALRQLIGQRTDAIDTPALVIDLDAMERNLTRMAEFTRKHGVRLRPHAKMHKSAALARLQMQAGAVGVCVQKTAEAEALAAGGVTDIYISNEVIALPKLRRVAALAQALAARQGRLAIAVDSLDGVARLAEAMAGSAAVIDVFVEIDVGQGRCGVVPGEAALVLAQAIGRHAPLRFAGLQAYHGRAQHLRTVQQRREAIAIAVDDVTYTRRLIEAAGIPVDLVTGAGTGTFVLEAASGVYGELQAGSFLFMDADYAKNERDAAQPQFEHALFVKTQVISVGADHAVCDAGHKSHAIDSGLPLVHALEPGYELTYLNGGDEHGVLRAAGANDRLPELGRMLWLIPGHCDPTVNLHDHLIGVRGGLLHGTVERIIRVDARGALT